ncbi:MAG: AEC family transporter [Candidatus Promineifilaceae bacterium]
MDSHTVLIINRVTPILLLLLLGHWTRRIGFLNDDLVDGLRKIVVNIALPAVLFVSFLTVELESSFIALAVIIFGLCVALYILGRFLGPRDQPDRSYFKILMTGF